MGTVRRLIVMLLVLGLVLAIVDVGSRRLAESRVAAQLQSSLRLAAPPEVHIAGTPFLAQAVRGRYDDVSVLTGPVRPPGQGAALTLSEIDAHLLGVVLPLGDLLGGKVSSVRVTQVSAQARVAFSTLTTLVSASLPKQVSGLTLARTPSGQLQVRGTYSGSGLALSLEAAARLTVQGKNLVITVPEQNLESLPAQLRRAASELLTTRLPLPVLPSGLRITAVTVEPSALAFAVQGRDVDLRASNS